MATRRKKSSGTATVAQRKSLYQKAESLSGKGSLKRIGWMMSSVKKRGGAGAKKTILGLAMIAEKKKAFAQGFATAKGRKTWNSKRKKK